MSLCDFLYFSKLLNLFEIKLETISIRIILILYLSICSQKQSFIKFFLQQVRVVVLASQPKTHYFYDNFKRQKYYCLLCLQHPPFTSIFHGKQCLRWHTSDKLFFILTFIFKFCYFLKTSIIHNMIYSIILFAIFTLSIRLDNVYQVVIIGAGIAGIGASKKLSDLQVPHLILQARDRIGGRIYSQNFQGMDLDMGAQYIHLQSNSGLRILMKDIGWKVKTVENPVEQYLYEHQGQLSSSIISTAGQVHQKLMHKVVHNAFASDTDLSVKAASQEYFSFISKSYNHQIRDTIKWLSEIQGNTQGADLSQLSAREIDTSDTGKDFMPQNGFQKFLYSIFAQCDGQIKFNERVTKIDYGSDTIRIYTSNDKVYKAKKVISSLPLGVLKAKKVHFQPPLPDKYLKIIDKLGVGNMNKLFVSFTNKFWNCSSCWLNFITNNENDDKFPIASVIPSDDKHILCFFLAGKIVNHISRLNNEQIATEVVKSLSQFYANAEIKVKNLKITDWDSDQYTLGSYSFYKVGTTMEDIIELRHPIANKIWFIGEHTHPRYASMTHGAFQTGEWAAEEIAAQIKQ